MNVLVPVSDLNSYIAHVNSIQPLTLEQELQYGKKVVEENDVESAQLLILHNLRHVVYVARKYSGYGLPIEDLIQEGNIGLMRAVRNYDYNRGYKLISFAIHAITSEIQAYVLSNWSIVKLASTKPIKKLFFNLRKMRSTTDTLHCSEIKAIAETLSVPERDVRFMEQRLSGGDLSLDVEETDDDYVNPFVKKHLHCDMYDPCDMLQREQQQDSNELVIQAIGGLNDRIRDIIVSRFITDKKATLHELAAKHNISAERVRQLELEGINKIKAVINDSYI